MGSFPEPEIDWHLPKNSWDTHVHVFEPAQYSYSENRSYSPEVASYSALLAFNANLTAAQTPQNIVLVQPSPYGTDNSLILDLLRNHTVKEKNATCQEPGFRKLRAITVFDAASVTDKQLEEWNDLGVRGFRINTEASGNQNGTDYELLNARIKAAADRVQKFNWRCQLFIGGEDWEHVKDTIERLPIKVIADHQGGMKGLSALPSNSTTTTQAGYDALLSLAKGGHIFIKISALYRSSKLTTGGYDDVKDLIKTFAEEVPDQLIWGSDWPHTVSGANRTEVNKYIPEPFRQVDDIAAIKNIRKWVGEQLWKKITVETAERVYK